MSGDAERRGEEDRTGKREKIREDIYVVLHAGHHPNLLRLFAVPQLCQAEPERHVVSRQGFEDGEVPIPVRSVIVPRRRYDTISERPALLHGLPCMDF